MRSARDCADDARALILVDVQNDYLDRADLNPPRGLLLGNIERLLDLCRARGIRVAHVHTLISPDGHDCMPHQRDRNALQCIAGTAGAAAPAQASPLHDEPVFAKTVFDPFSNPALGEWLHTVGVRGVLVAGVHTHACVRETALGAYQRGFEVSVVDDAIASYDPLHAALTRAHLDARRMRFASIDALFDVADRAGEAHAARIAGAVVKRAPRWTRRNPAQLTETLGEVAAARPDDLDRAVARSHIAQLDWAARAPEARAEVLAQIADRLDAESEGFVDAIVRDIGKPIVEARAEVQRSVELTRLAIRYFCTSQPWQSCGEMVHARRAPLGTIAAITPFNHALGIAFGKLLPALALGNAVVWKPSIFGADIAERAMDVLAQAGLPPGLVALVHGDGGTALALARHAGIAAVSVTASETAGRQLALACAADFKPLQAELGGNNAVVVMHDADIEAIAGEIARAAFGFAGQRCTAGRRIVVVRERERALVEALRAATLALAVGDPFSPRTEVGPLVSAEACSRIEASVASAVAGGAELVCGGHIPAGLEHGAWYAPTLLRKLGPDAPLFQEESFGPIALVTSVDGFDQALEYVNGVRQGLIATLYSHDEALQRRFLAGTRTGVVKFNCAPSGVHAEAPFGGWKASGFGPPEHGRWDAEFYSRAQAIYGMPARKD